MKGLRFFASISACAALALAASGCAPKVAPTKLEPETLKDGVSAVRYERYVRNEGFRGNFAFQTHDIVTLTADRKMTDTTFEWTGEILGKVLSKKKTRETIRLDKDMTWLINLDKEKYREFPIKDMAAQMGLVMSGTADEAKAKEGEQIDTVYVEECVKCVTKTSVDRPGAKKVINGYDAEEVVLNWSSTCKSLETGKEDKTVSARYEIWLASDVKFAEEINGFNTALAKKNGVTTQMLNSMGEEVAKKYPLLKDLALMIGELKGYPIYHVMTIEDSEYLKEMQEKRKREAEQEAKSGSDTSFTGMAKGFVKGKLKEREEEKQREDDLKWGNIIFRVTLEERNFTKVNASLSDWNLPENFKKDDGAVEKRDNGPEVKDKPAKYVQTACFTKLTESALGMPLYPGAKVARPHPYNKADHNTKYHYTGKDSFHLLFSTGDKMDQVVQFYKSKMKMQCTESKKKTASIDYKEDACTEQTAKGAVPRTLLINDRPVELVAESGKHESNIKETERIIGFELTANGAALSSATPAATPSAAPAPKKKKK